MPYYSSFEVVQVRHLVVWFMQDRQGGSQGMQVLEVISAKVIFEHTITH